MVVNADPKRGFGRVTNAKAIKLIDHLLFSFYDMISVLCHTLHMNSISLIWKNSILCLRFVLTLLSNYVPLIVLEKVNKLEFISSCSY